MSGTEAQVNRDSRCRRILTLGLPVLSAASLALVASACAEAPESQDDPDNEPAQVRDETHFMPESSLVGVSAAAGDPCFDWPLGGSQGGSIVPGWNTYVMQNYANRGGSEWYSNRAHSGVDLALNSGSTAYAPVYAAANGVVKCVVNANYPGWVTVIEHTMGNGTKKYTQYGHTNQPSVAFNTPVTKGQQIATLLPAQTNHSPHLHFEVRNWLNYSTGNCYGPGYATGTNHPDVQGWANPIDWHFGHRAAFPGQGVTDINQNVRNAPNISTGSIITTLTAGTRYSVSQVSPDTSGSKEWWYRLQYATNAWGWAAGYQNLGWGGEIYVVEPVRSCGSSTPPPAAPYCSANCGGGGWWCSNDGACIVNGVPGHNYHCPGNNVAPDRDQACANGCVIAPSGFPDYCRATSFCGGGAWCGNDCVNGHAKTLYNFNSSGAVSSVTHCEIGYANQNCVTAPAGSPDYCN